MQSTAFIIWALLFSGAGLGYLVYGRRRRAPVPFFCGLALCVYPYFVDGTFILLLIGSILVVLPYFLRRS